MSQSKQGQPMTSAITGQLAIHHRTLWQFGWAIMITHRCQGLLLALPALHQSGILLWRICWKGRKKKSRKNRQMLYCDMSAADLMSPQHQLARMAAAVDTRNIS